MNSFQSLYFLVLILSLSCCSESRTPFTNEIEVKVSASSQFSVNGKLVTDGKLKEILLSEKNKLIKANLKESEISIILRVDDAAKRWALSDLEAILRELNLRKVKYIKKAPQFSSDPEHTS